MTSRITVNNIESNSGISSIALDSGVTIETGSGLNVSSGILTASTLSATTVSTTTDSAGGQYDLTSNGSADYSSGEYVHLVDHSPNYNPGVDNPGFGLKCICCVPY